MSLRRVAAVALAAASTACASAQAPIVQPGRPGEAGRSVTAAAAADLSGVRHTAADVRFVQAMIGHHAQALEMTDLVAAKSTRDDVRLLARRIADTQADEIRWMRTWLTTRGEALPGEHAHHAGDAMPGMLTDQEMDDLRAATSEAFDERFLQLMIKHHEGALVMVHALFAADAAGQEPDLFAFASDVVSDQSMEIRRMVGMMGRTDAR